MSDDFGVIETDRPGGKVDYHTMLMIMSINSGKLLSHINEVPPGLHQFASTLSDDDLKPNRVNYVYAVESISIKMTHLIQRDELIRQELDDLEKKDYDDPVKKAMDKERILFKLMAKEGLLPLQQL